MPNKNTETRVCISFQPLTQKYVLCFMIYMLHFRHSKIAGIFLFDYIYFKELKKINLKIIRTKILPFI